MPNTKKVIIITLLLLGAMPSAYSAENATFSMSGGVEKFNWREFDSSGRELLEESGLRYTFGGNFDNLRRLDSGGIFSLGVAFLAGDQCYFIYI